MYGITPTREYWREKERVATAEARRERIEEDFAGGGFEEDFAEALCAAFGANRTLADALSSTSAEHKSRVSRALGVSPSPEDYWRAYWQLCCLSFGDAFCERLRDKIIEREMRRQ